MEKQTTAKLIKGKKGKVVPAFNEAPRHEGILGE
jgi:hypothetical protein